MDNAADCGFRTQSPVRMPATRAASSSATTSDKKRTSEGERSSLAAMRS